MTIAPPSPPSTAEILALRPPKNVVDPRRPYAFLAEKERSAEGELVDVATVFLTNRECPFRCLMCDLWKNTTDHPVAPGDIPAQIDYALARLGPARHAKLYNSGNFFDTKAIPPSDYAAIAHRLASFERVVVENHPKLCDERVLRFRDLLDGELEVALGLETAHPEVLKRLNKSMTLADFSRAAQFLRLEGIAVRAFILLRPPFLSEEEGVEWAIRSIDFAFGAGVECCSVIPTRAGNGAMEVLEQEGLFEAPTVESMERVLAEGIRMRRGRVLMDLWDVQNSPRRDRLERMNLLQEV